MKKNIVLTTVPLLILFLFSGCATPDQLPPIPDYKISATQYDTSAVIELLPHCDDKVNKAMLKKLQRNGYQVQQGLNYRPVPPDSLYVLEVVDWSSRVYECEDDDYLDTRVIVMVRNPGIVLDGKMYAAPARYFQSYSQMVIIGKHSRLSGLDLALDHLFLTGEFRKALEPVQHPRDVMLPAESASGLWRASLYYQAGYQFDLYQALRWAFLALDKGSDDARKYIAESALFGELFSNMQLLSELAKRTPAGQYKLGMMLEYGKGIPIDKNKAFQAYSTAAWHGIPEAQYALGRCYHYGIGTEVSLASAYHWYSKAAAARHFEARKALDKLKQQIDD